MAQLAAWLSGLLLFPCTCAMAEPATVGVLGDHSGNALVAACAELGLAIEADRPSPKACAALLVCSASYPEPAALSGTDAALVEQFLEAGKGVYLEYAPAPGLCQGPVRDSVWERLAAGDQAGGYLPPLTLLDEHSSRTLPVEPAAALPGARVRLVWARAAGVDRAVFGLPAETTPALVEVPRGEGRLVICGTALSHATRGRWKPSDSVRQLAREVVLALLEPGVARELRRAPLEAEAWTEPRTWVAPGEEVRLWVRAGEGCSIEGRGPEGLLGMTEQGSGLWSSAPLRLGEGNWTLRITIGRDGRRCEREVAFAVGDRRERYRETVRRNLNWFRQAGMLPAADGSRGVLEGLFSALGPDGKPQIAGGTRVDCVSECALLFALWGAWERDRQWADVGTQMLGYTGRAFQVTAPGSWYLGHWQSRGEYAEDGRTLFVFSDDSGAATLFSLLGYAASGEPSLLESGLRGAEFFLRTASERSGLWCGMAHRGYEGSGELGTPWPVQRSQEVPNAAPHVVNLPLASLLVAYRLTGESRYLEAAERGIRTLMAHCPDWPIMTSRTCEHTRMLLPVALLQAAAPSAEHREWLDRVAGYLLANQDPCGALHELDGCNPWGNEGFGVGENSVFQANGDPISDQLYDTGFAALHLWLAYQVTGEKALGEAFERLADYACRIQLRDPEPLYDGTWLRAFDYRRWEYFGSPADIGWGPYCAETGWQCAPLDLGLLLSMQGREAPLLGVLPEATDSRARAMAERVRAEMEGAEAALLAPPPRLAGVVRATVLPGNRVHLTWPADPLRATRFSVYRAGAQTCEVGPQTLLGTTHEPGWDDWSAEADQTYTYRVAASNGLGDVGEPGDPVTVRTGPGALSRGCAYAKSLEPAHQYPDSGGAESTDGVYGGRYGDGKSYGYRLGEVGDACHLEVTLDLGGVREVCGASHQNCGAPDYRPDVVRVETSADGLTWSAAGETRGAIGGRMWLQFTPAQARWVRFVLDKTRTGPTDDWLFVGELEVY